MSKAIIVTEMQESCDDCPSCIIGSCTFCGVNGKKIDQIEIMNEGKKPDWCPMKEIPYPKETDKWEEDMKYRGWYDCISEIIRRSNIN